MGETRNESSSFRKARDHQPGRAVPFASAANAANTRHWAIDVLPMVRPLPKRWPRSARRQTIYSKAGLEPDSRSGAGTDCDNGSGIAGAQPTRTRSGEHTSELQ